jgi:AcrR family transcriptional regulator
MELYRERGFEGTTVADIAERAGLTERTFFRHFADKREVLFGGAGALQEFLVRQVEDAAPSLSPIEVMLSALTAAAVTIFEERKSFATQRQYVIAASEELQEREQIKLATLALVLADAMQRRGVDALPASLAAETGIAVFKIAFERWIGDAKGPPLSAVIRECADELEAVAAGRSRGSPALRRP